MPFVITTKTGKISYLLNLGDTIDVADPTGRHAVFEIVNVMGIANDFALVVVDKAGCERDEDGWTPGVEGMVPIGEDEFLAGGDYLVLRPARSNPGRSAMMFLKPHVQPPTRTKPKKSPSPRRAR